MLNLSLPRHRPLDWKRPTRVKPKQITRDDRAAKPSIRNKLLCASPALERPSERVCPGGSSTRNPDPTLLERNDHHNTREIAGVCSPQRKCSAAQPAPTPQAAAAPRQCLSISPRNPPKKTHPSAPAPRAAAPNRRTANLLWLHTVDTREGSGGSPPSCTWGGPERAFSVGTADGFSR